MTDPNELAQSLAEVARALDALSVRWAVGGSVASATYGEPRATNDVDIVAALDEKNARTFASNLGDAYYADADMAADAVRRHGSFNIIDNRTFIKIDIFVPASGPLGLGQLDRRTHLDVFPGLAPIPVLGAEDVVLQKLRWFREGGEVSDRQWRDIVSVLRAVARRLDSGYLRSVAQSSGMSALLDRALRDAS